MLGRGGSILVQLSNRWGSTSVGNVAIFGNSVRNFAALAKGNYGKIQVEGFNLYWERHGKGPHVVLCCPGLAGSIATNYWPVFEKMDKDKFTFIGIDPPGYGKSRPPDRDVWIEEFSVRRDARLAVKLMKQLGYERFSALGWSNGGYTSISVGLDFPEVARRVVACNTPLHLSQHINNVLDHLSDLSSWAPEHRKALLRTYEKPYALKILREWRDFLREEVARPNHFDKIIQDLKTCEVPVLYIHGSKDIFVPPKEALSVLTMCVRPTLHSVTNGTHYHLDFLDEFCEATTKFLVEDDK